MTRASIFFARKSLRRWMDCTATRACPSCALLCAASRVNPTCGVKPGNEDLNSAAEWVHASPELRALHWGDARGGLARERAIHHLNEVPNVVLERHACPAFSSLFSTAAA